MGVVNIPPDPSGPGHASVHIDIGKAELQSINALLRQVQFYLELESKEQNPQEILARFGRPHPLLICLSDRTESLQDCRV